MAATMGTPPTFKRAGTGAPADINFRKEIGSWALTAVSMGNVIGSGWLFSAMFAATTAGPAAIVSWSIALGLVACIGVVYAELGASHPEAGGVVRYSAYSNGLYSAGLISFATFLALVAGGGAEATAVITYMSHFWPSLLDSRTGALTATGTAVAVTLMISLVALATLGIKWFSKSNLVWTTIKVLVPVITIFAFFMAAFHPGNFAVVRSGGFAPYGTAGIFAAIPTSGMMYAFGGFRQAINLGAESKNARRDIPRVLFRVLLVAGVIYIALQVAWIAAVPSSLISHGWAKAIMASPWASLAVGVNLTWLSILLYADSVVSPAGVGWVATNVGARVTYSMGAPTKLLPLGVSKLSVKGVPLVALGLNLVLAVGALALLRSWHSMVAVLSTLLGVEYGIGAVAVMVLRTRNANSVTYRAVPYVAPLAFVVAGLISFWAGWDHTRIGFPAIILLGSAVYAWSHIRYKKTLRDLLGGVWLVPYVSLLLLVSYLGTYGGGIGVIPKPWDSVAAGAVALAGYIAGVRSGLWYTSCPEWREDVLPGLQHPGAPVPASQAVQPGFF